MKFDIGILHMAQNLAAHAIERQSVIAQNIANADTPGYKALDTVSFSERFAESIQSTAGFRPVRKGHIPMETTAPTAGVFNSASIGSESPNGNSVSLEDQLVRAAEVRHQHDLALGVYGKSLDILRAGLGRIR